MDVLFVTHKWGDAEPGTGESVVVPHLIDTFMEAKIGRACVVWNDELYHEKANVHEIIAYTCKTFKPDLIVYTPIPAQHLEKQNISPEMMRISNIPILSVFFDLADEKARQLSLKYAFASDLSVNVDGDDTPISNNFLSLWPARTLRPVVPKTIDISFIGARRSYPDRLEALNYLANKGLKLKILGGRSENPCTFKEYMDILDSSLITLNFSKTQGKGKSQIKARVIEAASAGCCLLEDDNNITLNYFQPGHDIIYWQNHNDLHSTLLYLLENRELAVNFGRNARNRFEEKFSSQSFWNKIVERCYKTIPYFLNNPNNECITDKATLFL